MKKLSVLLSALALALAVALPASATQYIVATGLNKYNTSYVGSGNFLNGCVPDAKNVFNNAILRGDWNGNGTNNLLLNAQGTFAAVSNKLMSLANTTVSGDVVLYYHSSHGYQDSGKNTGICMYDKDMSDSNFAKILANFKAGVKVVIMLDTCHSGGMFKSVRANGSTRTFGLSGMDFAARVNEELAAIRADEAARGIKASAKLAILDCGWVTAADYNQYSWDGDEGGAFTECYIGSCKSGDCDRSPYGNGDGYATMYEMFKYAVAQDSTHGDGKPGSEDYTMPQCTNTTVLSAVTYGWVGREEPSGVRFAAIPEQSATVGTPLAYTLSASNTDGSAAANITISIKSSTAPSSTYSLNGKAFSFTPAADGTFTFNFVATNTANHTGGKATMTVNAALAAPVALAATGVGQTSFTANWQSIAGASSYFLSVAKEASTAARTTDVPDGDPDYLADFSSISGSGSSDLKDEDLPGSGWEYVKAFSDSGRIKIGSSKAAGSIATPAIAVSGNAVAVFDIASYSGDSASVVVSAMHSGDSDWTDLETLTPAEANAPIAVEIPADSGTVQLKLESASSSKCRFYVYSIALYDGAGSSVFSGDVGDVLAYTVNGLENDTTYTYKVRGIGNAPGPWSDSVTVRTVDDPTAPPSLFAISDKLAELGDTVQFDIGYASAAAAGAVAFNLTDPSGLASIQDGVFSFTPAAPGVFSFTIVASNSNGNSAPVSFTVTVDIPAPDPEPPTSVGSDSFVANWQAVAGASSYLLTVYQGQVTPPPPVGTTVTDTFTTDRLGISGTTYVDLTNVSDLSTAIYAIKAAENSGAIQLNSKNDIGLVSTTSGGAPAKVTISWNSTTAANRWLDVYASATPYSSVADLYNANTQGTLVGSLSYDDGDTELEISGTYAYIGLRSRSSALYLDHIRIDWVSGAAKAAAREDVVIFSQDIGNVTHYTVTGLAPETSYTYTVAAIANGVTGAVSQATTVTTSAGPAAPAWSSIPAQTAIVDKPFSIDLASYVTGSPTPALSLTAGSATLNGTVLSFTPSAETSYSFTVLASNDSGTSSATFTVDAIVHSETKYAVCVGINEYEMISSLEGCVNDSYYFYNSLVDRGGWLPSNMVRLNDAQATKNGIRNAISNVAAVAVAGDVFIYQHSSHGGNKDTSDVPTGKDVYLCVYDEDYYNSSTAYNDYELAADLAKFASGVKVVVVVDACFSGGLFKSKDAARAAAADFDLAGRVSAIMDADRTARRARGEDVSRTLSSSEIGWVTAANYNETSLDGGFYHSDAWLTDPEYGDEYWDDSDEAYYYPASYKQGGVFLASATWGWWNGDADKKSAAGNNDGFCDGYEFWQAGYDFASQCGTFWGDSDYNFTPQHTNDAVLRSVEFGAAGFEEVDAPTALAASDVTGSSFTANWTSISNAVSYVLEVSVVADPGTASRSGSADFALVSDPSDILSGEYVILSAGTDVAMNSTCSGASSGYLGCTDVLVTDDVVSTDDASLVWTLEGDADSCTLYSAAAGKFANPATAKNVGWSDTAAGSWSVSSSSDGMLVANNADSSWKLQYNVSSPRFACYSSAQRKLRLFRATGSGVILSTNVGNVTSFTVTGLEPGTYAYRVKAVAATASSDFSNTQNVTLYTGPAAPVWSSIPVQDAIAGELFSLDLAPFVSGSPAPVLSVSSGDATLAGTVLSFTPATAGNTSVIILATNESGNAMATVSVAVGLAAPEALAASSVGSASFVANWSAVAGATSYDLVVTEGQGDTPGPGPGDAVLTETFANVSGTSGQAVDDSQFDNEGWTLAKVLYKNDGEVQIGSGSYAGSLTSPAVEIASGAATVVFSAKAYGAKENKFNLTDGADDSREITLSTDYAVYTQTFENVSSTFSVSFVGQAAKKRFYLNGVTIYDGVAPTAFARAEGDIAFSNSVGNVTSYTVTGLAPLTEYSYVVRACRGSEVSEWSNAAETKTTDGPAAPAWSAIPAQGAYVDELFSLDLAAYVSGSPAPVLSLTAGNASLSGTVVSFIPASAGDYPITVLASNEAGTASVSFTVTATVHTENKYALHVGINVYQTINSLYGCVNDANYFRQSLIERGGWQAANMTLLTDSQATKAAIRAAISNYAAIAVAGDTFIYQHSSHGGNTDTVNDPPTSTDVFLCVYDERLGDDSTAYNDYELAADLAQFASGVKVVVLADACFSGGLLRSKAVAPSFDLAGRVTAIMNADRAARKARGEDVSRGIDPSEIGWITAARFDETSQDGGFYHIDLWLDDPTYGHQYVPEDENKDPEYPEDFRPGGVFTAAASWAWWHGTADTDNDDSCDAYEFWQAGYDFCSQIGPFWGGDDSDSFHPQCTNIAVLQSVELGSIGIEETDDGTALPASNVTDSSFTANWSAVSNAVAYYLRISTDKDFDIGGKEAYIEEGFDTISPEGWTVSNGNGEYHSSPYIGTLLEGKYSLKFSATGQYAITPEFEPDATALQFWAYGNGTNGSVFTVSAKVDGEWKNLGDAAIAKGGSLYGTELPEGTTQIRFDFTKVVNCALDDVIVFTEKPSKVLFEDLVTGTSFTIDDDALLEVDKAYYYIVPVAASGATGDQSEVIEVTLGGGLVAPSWTAMPNQHNRNEALLSFDVRPYVAGTPAPEVTLVSSTAPVETYTFEGDVLIFQTTVAGTYTFTFRAENSEGTADATLSVVVTAGPTPHTDKNNIEVTSCSFHDFGEDSFFCQASLITEQPAGTEIGIWVATDLAEADWVLQSVVELPADGILDVEIDFDPTASKTCFISFGQPRLTAEP